MEVETGMTRRDLRCAVWRKSSHSSGGTQGECVEVAALPVAERVVGARDSTNPGGPVLSFTAGEWETFLDAVKRGAFG
jgi:Domain of unknown function (DUF397).